MHFFLFSFRLGRVCVCVSKFVQVMCTSIIIIICCLTLTFTQFALRIAQHFVLEARDQTAHRVKPERGPTEISEYKRTFKII